MAKKKQEDPPKGSPAWMATFSDLMNLLLCFFVLLFSMASVDAAKFEIVVNSLKSAFSVLTSGGSTLTQEGNLINAGINAMPSYSNRFGDTLADTEGNEVEDGTTQTVVEGGGAANQDDINEMTSENQVSKEENIPTEQAQQALAQKALEESEKMAEQIEALVNMYGLQQDVEIDYNGQYVRLTLNGALLFRSGQAEVRQEAYTVVDNIGKILDTYRDSLIEVDGHTDNVPMRSGKYEDNDVLSMYRALSVANRLRSASKIDPGNILSAGRGDYVPIADNSTEEGRARNRRVEILIHNSFSTNSLMNN